MPCVVFGLQDKARHTPTAIEPSHRIDVWIFNLDCSPSELADLNKLLSADEQARRQNLKHFALAARWTVAHARLRQILGSYLQTTPYQGDFVLGSHGKPGVSSNSPTQPLNFSLSHSGEVCGVAVCRSGEIGLDIEMIGSPPWEIEADVFTEREQTELASYAGPEQQLAFYRGWTRKEAVIKAMGLGLSFPLQDLDVDLAQTQTRLRRLANSKDPVWTIAGLEKPGLWIGALAMQTAGASIDVRFRDTGSYFGTPAHR